MKHNDQSLITNTQDAIDACIQTDPSDHSENLEFSPLKPMRIGQLAHITQKTTRTLRLYEEQGLLQPLGRTDGGFRLYAPENIHRIHYIQKLQQLGYSLNQIQSLLDEWKSYADSREGMKAMEEVYRRQLLKVKSQIEMLQNLEKELVQSIDFIKDCHPCQQSQTEQSGCRHCDRPDVSLSELILGLAKG
jgi:DNA-binding transcriptional MerR regulator